MHLNICFRRTYDEWHCCISYNQWRRYWRRGYSSFFGNMWTWISPTGNNFYELFSHLDHSLSLIFSQFEINAPLFSPTWKKLCLKNFSRLGENIFQFLLGFIENRSQIYSSTNQNISISINIADVSIERSFSKIKTMKNRLRTTINDKRLHSLLTCNVEVIQKSTKIFLIHIFT